MKPTILICGHGPGISDAVARRFGREGLRVAIVARDRSRLGTAERALRAAGLDARAFVCDLANPEAVVRLIGDVRDSFGPIHVLHWNAYGRGAKDLATARTEELRAILDVSVTSMIAAVQAALPDLADAKGSVLVTGGGLALYDPNVDAMATQWGAVGLAIGKAAQHKTVGLLHARLARDNIYVGEIVVTGSIKGSAFDTDGKATIDPADVAEKFWTLARDRRDATVTFAG